MYIQNDFKKKLKSLKDRFQLIKKVEIASDNTILSCFSHIWKNPHWYTNAELITSSTDIKPTVRQLQGVGIIRKSVIQFSLENTPQPVIDNLNDLKLQNSGVNSNSLYNSKTTVEKNPHCIGLGQSHLTIEIINTALLDVFSRLIESAEKESLVKDQFPLQAFLETKRILGFFQVDQICLLRCPRFLRRLLWDRNLKFTSLFGHSCCKNPLVNVSLEDFNNITDRKPNFPGYIRWLNVLQQERLSEKNRQILHRLRQLILFVGVDEVIPFLHLLKDIIEDYNQQHHEKNNTESSTNAFLCNAIDVANLKRLLCNFTFRNSCIQIPKLLWNSPLGIHKWYLSFQCYLLPISQKHLIEGLELLTEPSTLQINFTLCDSSIEAWSPLPCNITPSTFHNLGFPETIFNLLPDVFEWLTEHALITSLSNVSMMKNHFLLTSPTLQQLPSSSYPSSLPSFNPLVSSFNEFPNQICKNLNQPLPLLNNQEANVKKGKRVGPAPSLVARLKKQRFVQSKPVMPSSPSCMKALPYEEKQDEFCMDYIWNALPLKYREALMCVNNTTILFVGDFPFSPNTVSLPFHILLSLEKKPLNYVTYVVISCTTDLLHYNLLVSQHSCQKKLRTLFWFMNFFQQFILNDNSITGNEFSDVSYTMLPYKNSYPLFEQILPKCITCCEKTIHKTSRNVFFLVPNFVLADLVSPLVCDPLSNVLLHVSTPTLRTRLWQMAQKQKHWEENVLKQLQTFPIDQLTQIKNSVLSSCPHFLVHLFYIFPFYTETMYHMKEPRLKQKILHHAQAIQNLQKEYPFVSPRTMLFSQPHSNVTNSTESRLIVWFLPLDFLEEAYTILDPVDLVPLLQKYHLKISHTHSFLQSFYKK